MKNPRQITIEFATKGERDLWEKWYRKDGCVHFFGWMMNSGKKWRAESDRKMKEWPMRCERLVE